MQTRAVGAWRGHPRPAADRDRGRGGLRRRRKAVALLLGDVAARRRASSWRSRCATARCCRSPGDLILFVSVAICGTGYAFSGTLSRRMPGWEVISWAVAISLPVLLPLTLFLWPDDVASVPWPSWAGLLYLALISQYFGFWLWNNALAIGGVARIGQVQLLQPFATLALAALLLGETIDLRMILFATAVVVVVALGLRRAGRTQARPNARSAYRSSSARACRASAHRGTEPSGADPWPRLHRPLGFLDRPRRHLHRRGGARSGRRAARDEAPVGKSRRLSRRGGRGDPAAARRSRRRADPGGEDRRGEDGDDRRHQRAARAQGRADRAPHHARVSATRSASATRRGPTFLPRRSCCRSCSMRASRKFRERVRADGTVEAAPDEDAVRRDARGALRRRLSLARHRLHACLEISGARGSWSRALAREMGFSQVSVSHEVSPLVKLVGRGDTTVVDAYLTPILRRYVEQVAADLGVADDPSRLARQAGLAPQDEGVEEASPNLPHAEVRPRSEPRSTHRTARA